MSRLRSAVKIAQKHPRAFPWTSNIKNIKSKFPSEYNLPLSIMRIHIYFCKYGTTFR